MVGRLMSKYALHPQIIHSIDNKVLHVGYIELIKLYKLDPQDCILWDKNRPEMVRGRNFDDYIHLYPKINGNYT